MRIAIDTRDLKIAKTGTKTYLDELCQVFQSVAPEHEFVFLRPSQPLIKGNSRLSRIWNHVSFYWWKEVLLPLAAWRNKCDLIFCTDYVVPLVSFSPTVPVFHDANFWANPGQYNRWWRKMMDILAIPAARKSPFVVTVSEFSRQEIAKYTGIPLQQIRAIPNAPKSLISDNSLTIEETGEILKKYNMELETPFMLHVGVMEKRKNLPRLIKAFACFLEKSSTDYQLVLIGQPGPKQDLDDSALIYSSIENLHLNDSVRLMGYISDRDLSAFYQKASVFVFPSLREGFGIPILEAFSNDVPVIASKSTAIPEVAGNAALYFDPLDIENIASSMEKITSQEDLRNILIQRGHQRLELFSWRMTARKLVTLFEEIELNPGRSLKKLSKSQIK